MLNHWNTEHTEGTENGWMLSGFSQVSSSVVQWFSGSSDAAGTFRPFLLIIHHSFIRNWAAA